MAIMKMSSILLNYSTFEGDFFSYFHVQNKYKSRVSVYIVASARFFFIYNKVRKQSILTRKCTIFVKAQKSHSVCQIGVPEEKPRVYNI